MVTGTARELREPLLEGAVGELTKGDPTRPTERVLDVKFIGKRDSDWKEGMRKAMARNVSFAILIGGAAGTRRELEYGGEWIIPVPIRATGGFAGEIWHEFRERRKDSFSFQDAAQSRAFDDLEYSSDGVALGEAAVSFIASRRTEIKRAGASVAERRGSVARDDRGVLAMPPGGPGAARLAWHRSRTGAGSQLAAYETRRANDSSLAPKAISEEWSGTGARWDGGARDRGRSRTPAGRTSAKKRGPAKQRGGRGRSRRTRSATVTGTGRN
jgi:hypothetical protein